MLVIALPSLAERRRPELGEATVESLRHHVVGRVTGVPEAKDGVRHVAQNVGRQPFAEEEGPEVAHVVRGLALTRSRTNKDDEALLAQARLQIHSLVRELYSHLPIPLHLTLSYKSNACTEALK